MAKQYINTTINVAPYLEKPDVGLWECVPALLPARVGEEENKRARKRSQTDDRQGEAV